MTVQLGNRLCSWRRPPKLVGRVRWSPLQLLIAATLQVWWTGCTQQLGGGVAENSPRQRAAYARTPSKAVSASWLFSVWLGVDSATSLMELQRRWANETWNVYGVVVYDVSGSSRSFVRLDPACGVDLSIQPSYLVFRSSYEDSLFTFPVLVEFGPNASPQTIAFRSEHFFGYVPVIALFPRLGRIENGGIVPEDLTGGSTPGVSDSRATGLVFLSRNASVNSPTFANNPEPLAHELIHLFTGYAHSGTVAVAEWYKILNVFSEVGETFAPVWNGQYPPNDVVYQRTRWLPSNLTLISTRDGASEYDQCSISRGSSWLPQP
jgi:hypothetical protein